METFLTVVLIVVLGLWLLKRLMPLLMVALLSRLARKGGGAFYTSGPGFGGPQRGASSSSSTATSRKEGEVTVEVLDRPERSVSESVGEYVEYGEVKGGTEAADKE